MRRRASGARASVNPRSGPCRLPSPPLLPLRSLLARTPDEAAEVAVVLADGRGDVALGVVFLRQTFQAVGALRVIGPNADGGERRHQMHVFAGLSVRLAEHARG